MKPPGSYAPQNDVGGSRSKKRPVIGEGFDGGNEIALGIGLHHKTARPSGDDFANQLVRVVEGDDEQFRGRERLANSPGGFDPVQLRHVDVQDDDVRLQFFRLGHRFLTGTRIPANFPPFANGQQLPDPEPHHVMVVRYQNPNRHLDISYENQAEVFGGFVMLAIFSGLTSLHRFSSGLASR